MLYRGIFTPLSSCNVSLIAPAAHRFACVSLVVLSSKLAEPAARDLIRRFARTSADMISITVPVEENNEGPYSRALARPLCATPPRGNESGNGIDFAGPSAKHRSRARG